MDGAFPGTADAKSTDRGEQIAPVTVLRPAEQIAPVVVSAPHCGRYYPPDLLCRTDLDIKALRRSEDSFTDDLFGAAPAAGMPLVRATYSRAYVDCNRDAFELDPAMFSDPLPGYVRTGTNGVRAGFGTIARRVAPDLDIYAGPLTFAEVEQRIARVHRPYHEALHAAIERTEAAFGRVFLIDAHSMPTLETPKGPGPDIILGDRRGASADAAFVDLVHGFLESRGYRVCRNTPYAGGFITTKYGRPDLGRHALQIEIDRGLYMDQGEYAKSNGFARVEGDIGALLRLVGRWTRRRPE